MLEQSSVGGDPEAFLWEEALAGVRHVRSPRPGVAEELLSEPRFAARLGLSRGAVRARLAAGTLPGPDVQLGKAGDPRGRRWREATASRAAEAVRAELAQPALQLAPETPPAAAAPTTAAAPGPLEAARSLPGQLLTLNQVTARLAVGRSALYAWLRAGRFPGHDVELTADVRGRRWRESTVLAWLDGKRRQG